MECNPQMLRILKNYWSQIYCSDARMIVRVLISLNLDPVNKRLFQYRIEYVIERFKKKHRKGKIRCYKLAAEPSDQVSNRED